MKTIGILGGVTWVSTTEYYKLINQKMNKKLGKRHTANILIHSLDYEAMYYLLMDGDWEGVNRLMSKNGQQIKAGGADFFAISSNTVSKVSKSVSQSIGLKSIDIFKSTAAAIKKMNIKRVALLGTKFTLTDPFFTNEFESHDIKPVKPHNDEIIKLNNIIMNELIQEVFTAESKSYFLDVMERMKNDQGIEGVILGCTEIPLLIKQSDFSLPLFDTTDIHTDAIVEYAIS